MNSVKPALDSENVKFVYLKNCNLLSSMSIQI